MAYMETLFKFCPSLEWPFMIDVAFLSRGGAPAMVIDSQRQMLFPPVGYT